MTHGDPAAAGQAGHAAPPRGRQTPVLTATQEPATSGGEDSGDNTTPTMSSKSGKMMSVKILMLDDSITVFQIQSKATGRILFDQVCKQLSLLEVDYFGLEYQDGNGITVRDSSINDNIFICIISYKKKPTSYIISYLSASYLFSWLMITYSGHSIIIELT